MCSPVKGRKDLLRVTYRVGETVSSLSHSTADHGKPSLYLASASEEVWSGDLAEKQMNLARGTWNLATVDLILDIYPYPTRSCGVWWNFSQLYKRCLDSLNDIIHSEMKILSSVDSTYHLEFLLATRWAPVHLTCENFLFFWHVTEGSKLW